ncbi:AcrR family transcriptional regulator [Caulobacter ginsengisoli]|uniref:AcrR family transcriptional regulator n=1 Tax=Caulobacter ginsengisoli TaxID=400775 RepID=A0ABU0ISE3_9CAUL|nr:TetR/AcrR family transcriptional regulator [Caulobacter ginsengisoli]MDQ0463877.1 AcrR family transcriptional regulator [Caulobacter ginsengisoli]
MPTSERPYHHGDLRRALVAEGEALLGEVGAANLALREVARRLGVSHNAPYRHFPTREALLAAIATAGFEALAERTDQAGKRGTGGVMQERGLAYVAFALERPAVFRLMFSDQVDRTAFPELAAAAQASLARASAAIGAAYGEEGDAVMAAWSFVHGLTVLLLDGQTPEALRKGRDDLALAKATLAAMAHAVSED